MELAALPGVGIRSRLTYVARMAVNRCGVAANLRPRALVCRMRRPPPRCTGVLWLRSVRHLRSRVQFCLVCRTPQPSLKSLSQHFEGKHAKIEMTPDKYEVDPGHTNHERELKKYHAEKSGVAVSGGAGGGGSRGGGGRGGGGRGKGKPKGNKGGPGAGKSLVPKRR